MSYSLASLVLALFGALHGNEPHPRPDATTQPGYYFYVAAESEDVVTLTHFDPESQSVRVL